VPWSDKKKYTYFDPARDTGTKDANGNPILGAWVNQFSDGIDFIVTKNPLTFKPNPEAVGVNFNDALGPAVMRQDGRFWLFAPGGSIDGPMPTHYEPFESPVKNPLYKQQRNPMAKSWSTRGSRYHEPGVDDAKYPMIISTYRITEHYLAGGMSRWLPWLAELMPELFVEISPELAAEKGIKNGDFVTVETVRNEIEARALVTSRIKPFVIDGKTVHEVGIPWHWGYMGLAKGDVTNDIVGMVGEPNTTIHEGKVFSGNLRAGRRRLTPAQIFNEKVAMDMDGEMTSAAIVNTPFLGEVENA
jgi:formate dehydrogenase major subunit